MIIFLLEVNTAEEYTRAAREKEREKEKAQVGRIHAAQCMSLTVPVRDVNTFRQHGGKGRGAVRVGLSLFFVRGTFGTADTPPICV